MGSSLFAIWDLLAGLEALHVQGLVHKDIKPENVLLVGHEWRLADFGLASGADASDLDGSLGGCRGTMKYLAPEQYSSLHHATIQSDIYSVGCILHDICGTEERIPLRKHTAPGSLGAIVEQATIEVADLRIPSVWMLRDELGYAFQEQLFRSMPIDVVGLQAVLREVGRRIERETILKTALALESSLEHQARVFLANALTERVIVQMYRMETGLWDRIGFGVCRLAREGGMASPLEVDRIISRLRLFGELGDTKVKAAVATAMLTLGARTRRANVSWWLARLLSRADAHLISRLEVAAPMIAARIGNIRSAISIVQNSGFDLDPRIVALLTQAAKVDKKTA